VFRIAYQSARGGAGAIDLDQAPMTARKWHSTSRQRRVDMAQRSGMSSVVNFNMTSRRIVRTNEYSSNLADFKLPAAAMEN